VKIRWRGHASFLIEAEGKKIVTDPFNAELGYPLALLEADLVTVSHEHWDHNAVETIGGQPQVIRGPGASTVGGIDFKGIATFHDRSRGRERGPNTVFKIFAEDLNLVHLGDLGHILSTEQVREIGTVDILLLPVGGRYTLDAAEAVQVVNLLQPKIVIPMHFATPHLSFALAPLEEFTSHYDQIIKKPYLEVHPDELGQGLRIIVLEYLSG
jgi:L-ascorbate metabolism protein UlaG (beta-lactamase superfamily)